MAWSERLLARDYPKITPALAPGNFSSGALDFMLSDVGLVYVAGSLIRNALFAKEIFVANLPSEYRPSVDRLMSGADMQSFTGTIDACVLRVKANGDVSTVGAKTSESGYTHVYGGVYVI